MIFTFGHLNISIISSDGQPSGLNLEIDDTEAGALAQTGAYTLGDWVYTGGTDMGMTMYAAAGGLAAINDPRAGYNHRISRLLGFVGGVSPTAPTAGKWCSIVYKANGVGTEYLSLYDSSSLPD